MAPALGTVLNKSEVSDREEAAIAVGQNVPAGLVYKFGVNDWRKVPVDGSVNAKRMYVLEKAFDNTNGTVAKTVIVYGKNAKFIGKADGVIVVKANVRASETAAHEQQLQTQADPTAPSGAYIQAEAVSAIDALIKTIAQYLGHNDELAAVGSDGTDAVDEDVDCVFQIKRLL